MSGWTVMNPAGFDIPESHRRVLRWTIYIGYAALVAGVFHGLANALAYARIDILQFFPGLKNYYQGLTAHGVANVLTFTFAFANGFLPLMTARALSRQLNLRLLWISFAVLLIGNILTIYAVTTHQASVLYTSYSPLKAHWTYYIGLALVVVSTWIATLNMWLTLKQWRAAHESDRIPLLAFISITSYTMWFLASLPIAVLFLGFLFPWSIGLTQLVDPLLNRTLFWFTGHAIVYAWLLPAYVSWYALIPRQVDGKVFSDSFARATFILFLVLSIPTGMHHQYTDPGIGQGYKAVHGVLTFAVVFPSFATAFAVIAALEMGGRARGGTGVLGWIRRLPWNDPSVTAQLLAMITFVFGGVTGLINASFTMNQVVHNTTWIPGHFHMTVGTAVALTFMGVAYWLVPYLTGRGLWSRGIALASSWVYTIGTLIFARGMISAGLEGMPRRIFRVEATYDLAAWNLGGMLTAIGGTLMFFGIMLFFLDIGMTILAGKKGEHPRDIPVSEMLTAPSTDGWEPNLDRLRIWVAVAVLLAAIAYGPFLATYTPHFVSPPFTGY